MIMDFDINSVQNTIDEYEKYIKSLINIMYEIITIPADRLSKGVK